MEQRKLAVAGRQKAPTTLLRAGPTWGAGCIAEPIQEIHTLNNQSNNGFINKINKGHNEVGLALEAAANFILNANGVASREPMPGPQPMAESRPVEAKQTTAGPTVGERLRELADLHRDGILSDDEFAGVKAKLLSGL